MTYRTGHRLAILTLLTLSQAAGAQETAAPPLTGRPAKAAPDALAGDTLYLKQALEPVLRDVRPAEADAGLSRQMIPVIAQIDGAGPHCLENPLTRRYRIDGGDPVDAVPVSAQAQYARYRFSVTLLLVAPPAGEASDRLCVPKAITVAEGAKLAINGIEQPGFSTASPAPVKVATSGSIAGFSMGRSGRTLSFADLFGSPLEELQQVFITSVPQGARVLDGVRPTRHRTDRVLALTQSDLGRIYLEMNGRRARLSDCERRPVTTEKAETHYHCTLGK